MTGGAGDLTCLGALVGRTEGGLASAPAGSTKPVSTFTPFEGKGDDVETLRDARPFLSSFAFGLPERRVRVPLIGG